MKKALMVLSLIFVFTVNLHSGNTIYVKATGSGVGTSWIDAASFQSALTDAISGDQIWVATGTYKPILEVGGAGARYQTFQMKNDVAIYGGFAGTEGNLSERNIFVNVTILSGDIGTPNVTTDNCYHVFYHPSGLTSSAVLDGFTIKGGNANGGGYPHDYGGGMYNSSSSPSLTNCTFSSNSAGYGGGMCNYYSSSPTLTNCTFTSNSVNGGTGGGMYNYSSSSPTLNNCTFTSNSSAYGHGGGIYSESSSPSLTNCTFSSNSADYGGGMYNYSSSSPTLNNCIIWGNEATYGDEFYINGGTTTLNYSCYANETGDISGALSASNCINSDPRFVGSSINATHPYSIPGNSTCVDVGNDSYNSEVYDIRGVGYSRKLDKTTGVVGTIDMGAYEYKVGTDLLPVELTCFAASANGPAVTLNWQTATEVNNYGFEIERRTISNYQITPSPIDNWQKIGFVAGNGTSNAPKEYAYSDAIGSTGRYVYRLKQVDNDGSFKYSQSIEVTTQAPKRFALTQNYPNPFNPATTINFTLESTQDVNLRVYDLRGREIAVLINGRMSAGEHRVVWNAAGMTSGVYFYKFIAGNFIQTKKLALVR